MSDDKLKNDPYSNPDMLKKEFIYPEKIDPETQAADPSRRRSALWFVAVPLLLLISAMMGFLLFGRLGYQESTPEVLLVVETKVNDESERRVWQLNNLDVKTAEGTFTEWLVGSPENDQIPWFRDVAYHAGTNAVYLTAASEDGLYVIPDNDGTYETMAFLDLSLRVNGSIEQMISYDDNHLLLVTTRGTHLAMYNVVTDRVIVSWPIRYQPNDPDISFGVFEDVVVDGDGRIYVLHTLRDDDGYTNEIQLFSGTGEYLSTLVPPTTHADFLTMRPNGKLYLHDSRDLFEYDPQTETWTEIELLPAFAYVEAAEFHPNGSLYTVGGSNAWLAEWLPHGEVGIAYPATENVSERTFWPLGETGDPIAMTILPDGSFLIIDGYINDFQRIFRLKLPPYGYGE